MSNLHFVLVHGAYHRAWHWHLVEEQLRKAGCQSTAINLPSGGQNPVAENAFALDTQTIKAAIEDAASKSDSVVIPVFHSYGGIPGTDALGMLSDAVKAKVGHLIYVGSFVMTAGKDLHSARQPSKDGVKPRLAAWAAFCEDDRFAYVPDPISPFYHDVEPGLAQEALKYLGKNSVSAYGVPLTYTGWDLYPGKRTYILCEDDRAMPRAAYDKFFQNLTDEQRAGWAHTSIPGSHSPFLSRPVELAKLLRKIAGDEHIDQGTRL